MNWLKAGSMQLILQQQKISSEIQGFTTRPSTGTTGTVIRSDIDTAVQTVIASQKVTGIET